MISVSRILLISLTLACVAIVIEIEWLDWKAGGAIARKAEQEPHSKWRISTVALDVKREYFKKNGISIVTTLTEKQEAELRELLRTTPPHPADLLGTALKTHGLWLHGIAVIGVVGGMIMVCRHKNQPGSRRIGFLALVVSGTSLVTALWRGYFSSLGW